MLHYHKKTRAGGHPAPTGIGWIDDQIAEIDTILDRGADRIGPLPVDWSTIRA
jgi:hypothetical protein